MNPDQAKVRADASARRYDRMLRGGDDEQRRAPTVRKGKVTSVDPLLVATDGGDGLPAANWSGVPVNVGDRVVLAVDAGRRFIIGRGRSDAAHVVYRRTSTVSIPSGAHTLLTWQTIDTSSGVWTATDTATVTVGETGLYRVSLAGHLTGTVSGWVQMTMTRNEASVTGDAPFAVGGENNGLFGANGLVQGTSRPLPLVADDVLRVFMFHNDSTERTLSVRGDVPIFALDRVR